MPTWCIAPTGKELLLPVPGSTTGRCSLFSYLAMEQLGPDLWNLTAAQLYTSPPTDHLFVDHGLQMLQVSLGCAVSSCVFILVTTVMFGRLQAF
jgi:hypothetical protein